MIASSTQFLQSVVVHRVDIPFVPCSPNNSDIVQDKAQPHNAATGNDGTDNARINNRTGNNKETNRDIAMSV
jgi:hypothetical protein